MTKVQLLTQGGFEDKAKPVFNVVRVESPNTDWFKSQGYVWVYTDGGELESPFLGLNGRDFRVIHE